MAEVKKYARLEAAMSLLIHEAKQYVLPFVELFEQARDKLYAMES